LMWNFTRFTGADLGGRISRTKKHGWTLTPLNDPRKLELMRCAYQKAVSNCANANFGENCPNCPNRMEEFYDPAHKVGPILDRASYDCLQPGCCTWFAYGPKKCVPKCKCKLVGNYCGTYVWLLPGGEDELTKLTLTILDFAMYDFPAARTKEVTMYYMEDPATGKLKPATSNTAHQVTKVVLPLDEDPTQVIVDPQAKAEMVWNQLSPEDQRQMAQQYLESNAAGLQADLELVERLNQDPEVGRSIANKSSLLELSSEEIARIRDAAPERYEEIRNFQKSIIEAAREQFIEEQAARIQQESQPSLFHQSRPTPQGTTLDILTLEQRLQILAPAGEE
jgi:hypothetical protein